MRPRSQESVSGSRPSRHAPKVPYYSDISARELWSNESKEGAFDDNLKHIARLTQD